MFYYLDGDISVIETNLVVVDVNGVGFACNATMNTISHLECGKKARLYTYCNVKEDAFDIYGFYELSEKRCFEMLLTVSGVGPKAALAILSAVTPEALAMAIITDDEKALTSAQGVGKKIAQRIILELKDKMSKEASGMKASGFVPPKTGSGLIGSKLQDATAALTVLGYSQSEISGALRTIDTDNMSVEEIIKEVLKSTMK
jgi:Holliday junction DNA helicase RuvA